jgi:uncharacterized protein YecE (DUF72 family)
MAISKSPIQPKKPDSKLIPKTGEVYLGCSGWSYASWKPGFYPDKTPARRFLTYYASQLNTVEVNYTFRKLPKPEALRTWLAAVEDTEFNFSFKAPQGITHFKRLRDCGEPLELFFKAIAPIAEAKRMGLLLFQLPPNFKADAEKLALFLPEAARGGFRIAFEFRHESWFDERVFSLLREHNAALCVARSDELASPDVQTANFSCYRLRESAYSPRKLKQIATDLRVRAASGDVFAYFKHEDEPDGPLRARKVLAAVRKK